MIVSLNTKYERIDIVLNKTRISFFCLPVIRLYSTWKQWYADSGGFIEAESQLFYPWHSCLTCTTGIETSQYNTQNVNHILIIF